MPTTYNPRGNTTPIYRAPIVADRVAVPSRQTAPTASPAETMPIARASATSNAANGGSANIANIGATDTDSSSGSLNWRDSIYNAAISRLADELAKYEADRALEAQNYETDFGTSLRNLGYTAGEGEFSPISLDAPTAEQATGEAAADQAAAGAEGVTFTPMGSFDYEGNLDPFSAAARGTSNLRNMFAARGTLRSSDYLREQQGFQKELMDQLSGMNTARTRFGTGLASRLADYRSQNEQARADAREAAIQRALAG